MIRYGYAWSVPAGAEQRVGVGSYEPRDHVKEPTRAMAGRLGVDAVRYQGNWFPHALRPAAEDGVFFVGDSAGHCFPLSGEGIRTAFYFGIACGRELRRVLAGEATRAEALAAYGAFSAAHAPAFRTALRLQKLIPALPPRALTPLLAVMGRERPCRRAFSLVSRPGSPALRSARAASGGPGCGGDRMTRRPALALAVTAALLSAAPARAQAQAVDFTDWSAVAANVASGTFRDNPVALAGSHVWDPPVSEVGGLSNFFEDAALYTPALGAHRSHPDLRL